MRLLFCVLAVLSIGSSLAAQEYQWTTHAPPGATDCTGLTVDSTGNIWVGSTSGIRMFDGTTWRTFTSAQGLPDNRIQTVAVAPTGVVWVGTPSGMATYDGNTWKKFDLGQGGNDITALFASPNGAVLWGTAQGRVFIYRKGINGDKPAEIPMVVTKLGRVTSIGVINSYGLLVFRSNQGIVLVSFDFREQIPINTSTTDLIPSNNVLCGVEVGSTAYDGTDNGLYVAGFASGNFGADNKGLPDLVVQSIAAVGDVVWCGTPKGLARRDGNDVRVYTAENAGLAGNDVRALVADRSGAVWAGFADGRVSVNRANETSAVPAEQPQTPVVAYPNPADDHVVVAAAGPIEKVTWSVIDHLGREFTVPAVPLGDGRTRLAVAGLPTGSYRCIIRNRLGEPVNVEFNVVR